MPKRIQVAIFVSGLALFFSGAASASGPTFEFRPYVAYDEALDSWPDAVVTGDVSGDGRDDVVLATGDYNDPEKAYRLFIYPQTQQGNLATPVQVPYLGTVHTYGVRMQIADLNNNGIQDIVVGHNQGITVLMSLGHLRFAVTKTELPGDVYALSSADLDGDGNTDVVRQAYDGTLSILLGDGSGAFRSVRSFAATAAWHQALKIADVTGDRLPDLVFTNSLSLTIYPGKGDGYFMPPRVYPFPVDDPRGFSSVAITDVNHDGRNDVLATTSANQPRSTLWIYTQTASGALSQPQAFYTYDMAEALTVADLDHNGYPDILAMHGGWNALGYYLQGKQGLAQEAGGYVPYATHYNQDGLATGDLDGDGCTDAAVADYNNGLIVLRGNNCFESWQMANKHDADFDGDGKADVLWHDAATGASVIWKSGIHATQIPMVRVFDTDWTIAGVGDFNGDDKSDVLWHHVVTGANTIWHSGDYWQSLNLVRIINPAWEIVGIGDFDGNGEDDILWRHKYSGANTIWDGGHYSKARNITRITDTDWKIVGVGDFDGNGRSDILWRHMVSGRNALWRNADYHNNQPMIAVPDVGWQVAGLGDFDNDARADILWRHAFDGRNAIWYSADEANSRYLARVNNLSWKVAGIGDFTHDGRSDILWRDSRTGANTMWRDANSATPQQVTGVSNMNWKIQR